MAKDLAGLLVVSVEQAVAAPYLSGRMAAAGARVIKVERPEGDFARGYDQLVKGQSAYFVWLNHGKESICLDLRTEADKEILAAMISKADIFIQNLAPGAITRLGFAPEKLREARPELITVSITGYGTEGPYREQKAYDLLVQAETGLASITGNEAGAARVGVSVCDIACGMTAYQAVLEALIGRGITGTGRHVEVSLFHALADWMNVPYLQYAYGDKLPARAGLSHPTIAPYDAYTGKDGQAVLLSIQNEREWAAFCADVMGNTAMAEDPRFSNPSKRLEHRAELDGLIEAAFASKTGTEIISTLEDAGIAFGRVSSIEDLSQHPQCNFAPVQTPGGEVAILAPGAVIDGSIQELGPVPALNQHGKALREEFGAKSAGDG